MRIVIFFGMSPVILWALQVDMQSAPWPTISPQAKNLVLQLLMRDPTKRLTASQVGASACPQNLPPPPPLILPGEGAHLAV